MSTLHTVNKSPYERFAFASCLAHVAPGDALLMLEDGVFAARRSGAFGKRLGEVDRAVVIYAIGPDLEARGVKREDVAERVEIVGYDGFVDLVADHARVCAWL